MQLSMPLRVAACAVTINQTVITQYQAEAGTKSCVIFQGPTEAQVAMVYAIAQSRRTTQMYQRQSPRAPSGFWAC